MTRTETEARARCQALLEVMRNRLTTRQFDPGGVVPRDHYDLILEAARHAPSGANAQPWHYIIVTDPETKKKNAERILLQSVAASTMSAHLAAAALGYNVWWVTAIGQETAQEAMRPLLGVPEELSIIDIFCFGPAAKAPYKRWKKKLDEIRSWDRFDMKQFMTLDQINEWIREMRHKVMYRDESKID